MERSKGVLYLISKITAEVLEQIPSINNLHAPHTSDEWLPTKEHYPESPACPLKTKMLVVKAIRNVAQPTHITLQMCEFVS